MAYELKKQGQTSSLFYDPARVHLLRYRALQALHSLCCNAAADSRVPRVYRHLPPHDAASPLLPQSACRPRRCSTPTPCQPTLVGKIQSRAAFPFAHNIFSKGDRSPQSSPSDLSWEASESNHAEASSLAFLVFSIEQSAPGLLSPETFSSILVVTT